MLVSRSVRSTGRSPTASSATSPVADASSEIKPEWIDEWLERRGRPPEGPINPDALASRVNIADPHGHQVTGGELRQWLVDAGYAEQDQFGRIVLKPDARRLVSQAFG